MLASNYSKKLIKLFYFWIFLIITVFPTSSFAQNTNTASLNNQTPTATQEKYYYYPLLEQKNFSDKTACNKEYTTYINSLLSTLSTQKLFDVNDESKRVVCFNDSKNANNFFYYKPGNNSSAKFQDEKSCEDSSKKDRESKYKTVIDAWNNYFGATLGKTISITDLPSLWSCTLVDQTKISAEEKAKVEENYYPLAQLPQLGEECTPDSTGKTICIKVAADCHQDPNNPKEQICTPGLGFAGYLNILIKIFIGICAVLAMIMIVMGGVQYMTSELVSAKSAAKETISKAILGLLLALGAYAILNTINPDLLKIGLETLPTATVTIEPDEGSPMLKQDSGCKETDSPVGICKVGLKKVGSFIVCGTYASQFEQLINAAKTAGYTLTGGACRSQSAQIELRKKNCGGNTTDASAKCDPPTALPGKSNHESGVAVDFVCNGKLINWQTNQNAPDYHKNMGINPETKSCYDWLLTNAPKYEFKYNFYKENWHWSYNGDGHTTSNAPGASSASTTEKLSSISFDGKTKKLHIVISGIIPPGKEHKIYFYKLNTGGTMIKPPFLSIPIYSQADQFYDLTNIYSQIEGKKFATVITSGGKSIGQSYLTF